MTNWIQVALPLCVGLSAGVMNWFAVQAKLQPVAFVAVNRTIPRGEAIHAGDLVKVEVAGDTRQLLRAGLPWVERGTAYSALAGRELFEGDLVLQSDVSPTTSRRPIEGEQTFSLTLPNEIDLSHVFADTLVSIQLGMDRHAARIQASSSEGRHSTRGARKRMTLGPYRVSSVRGDNLPHLVGEASRQREGERTLSIIARLNSSGAPDSDTQRLLNAAAKTSGERITAVFVRESGSNSPSRTASVAPHQR